MEKVAALGDRLRQIMDERGLTFERLGEVVGLRPQTLNRYVLGQREPKASAVTQMAFALNLDPLWLQGYSVPQNPPAGQVRLPGESMLPILGVIRAGNPAVAQEEILGWASADVPEPQDCFYLRVRGDSMAGAGIQEGDLVLIRRQPTAENGQIVACVVDGEDATLKRFRRQGEWVILQPENPAYEPRLVPASDFEAGRAAIVGVALKMVRDL